MSLETFTLVVTDIQHIAPDKLGELSHKIKTDYIVVHRHG